MRRTTDGQNALSKAIFPASDKAGICRPGRTFKRAMRPFLLASMLFAAASVSADTLTFNVIGIDCAMCAPPVKKALAAIPGVTAVRVDAKTKTATLDIPAEFDRSTIHRALSNAGFEAQLPGETNAAIEPLPAAVLKTLDLAVSDGKTKVNIDRLVVPGKITIVDFYADWCGPCRVLETRIERYMVAHPGIAVRRIDIGKWDNAAAKQATKLGATALPYIRVYDRNRRFVRSVTGGMWDEVTSALDSADRSK